MKGHKAWHKAGHKAGHNMGYKPVARHNKKQAGGAEYTLEFITPTGDKLPPIEADLTTPLADLFKNSAFAEFISTDLVKSGTDETSSAAALLGVNPGKTDVLGIENALVEDSANKGYLNIEANVSEDLSTQQNVAQDVAQQNVAQQNVALQDAEQTAVLQNAAQQPAEPVIVKDDEGNEFEDQVNYNQGGDNVQSIIKGGGPKDIVSTYNDQLVDFTGTTLQDVLAKLKATGRVDGKNIIIQYRTKD